jgi:hypothetical protein
MITLTAHLNVVAFAEVANGLSREDSERVAAAFPDLFASAFRFYGVTGAAEAAEDDAAPPKPGPAKARKPKASPTVDKGALASAVFAYVRAFPNVRAEEVEVTAPDGMDAKTWNRVLRGFLERFVADGKMYADGERRGRRYKVAVKAAEPEEGAAE